jgi:cyclophilin family peptidyl-prolyl cis-trans isomerase
MDQAAQITVLDNEPLSLFLAMERELSGRRPWELCLLARPHAPEVGPFAEGIRLLQAAGITRLPIEIAEAADIQSFASSLASSAESNVERGWDLVRQSLSSLEAELRTAIEFHAPPPADALTYVRDTLLCDAERCMEILTAALGVSDAHTPLSIYLVPFAPFPPGSAFLMAGAEPRAAYLDYRRFSGPMMLEGVLTLISWRLLALGTTDQSLRRQVAPNSAGPSRAERLLKTIAMKTLVAMTAQHIVSKYEPQFSGSIVTFGHELRFPRLMSAIAKPWEHYLEGRTSRARAIGMINDKLSSQPAAWFVEQIDAASLAADFYLLEWLTGQGNREASTTLATWQPRLAASFAYHLDCAIGAELAHYDGIPLGIMKPELVTFIETVCQGNSLLRWPAYRMAAGTDAYLIAEKAFQGPGAEYGGDAWHPIARLLAQYSDGTISERVFIDQSLTLEHNNGCLFDKFYDTWDMQETLRAQAEGDLVILTKHASAEVRRLVNHHLATCGPQLNELPPTAPQATGESGDAWSSWSTAAAHTWPAPGSAGCGSSVEVPMPGTRILEDTEKPLFRGKIRKPHRRDVPALTSATALLHTGLGLITLNLDPAAAPLAVGTFVQLARGEIAWRDPATGGTSTKPFYDGTRFHRIVPGFLLQAGDRTESGRGGPGFRYDEEPTDQRFDRPYLVAMVNTGVVTNGSQFFITLATAPHLDGQYTIIGELADDESRETAIRISDAALSSRSDLRILHVELDAR